MLGWKPPGSLLKALEDPAYALAVSTADKPIDTNPAVNTSEDLAPTVLRCARRVMLTPRFLIRYHCEFSQQF